MAVSIKKLSLKLTDDYLDFFDHRAFSDNNPNGPCYCTSPNMKKATEKVMVSEFGNDIKGTIRRYAVEMLREEKINGYLAYDGDLSIGWCNAGDMESYDQFIPEFARENSLGKTYSVVCFEIAPEYRGRGIATAFLNQVCEDAKREGYQVVEGYAKLRDDSTAFDYTGPIRLFEKAGFIEGLRKDNQVVMRKIL